MKLNVTYDANTLATAPADFYAAVNYVVNLFDSTFTNNATINLEIGYGDFPYDGTQLTSDLGVSQQNNIVSANYSQVTQALVNEGAPGASTLPPSSPIIGQLMLGSAQEQALGLIGSGGGLDGWVGIASNAELQQFGGGSWSFSPTATPGASQYYLVGVIEHEFTEAMGRNSFLDTRGQYAVVDLYRYAAPGVRQTGTGDPAYFSINNGLTNLDSFNDRRLAAGDLGDWAPNVGHGGTFQYAGADAFDNNSLPGQINGLTSTDLTLMAALGWDATPTSPPPPPASPPPPPPPPVIGRLITLGAGPQAVVGGVGDTIIGGSGPDVINGLAGLESIIGGSGATTIYGGVGDTIAAGSGDTYVDGTAGGMAIAVGSGGTDTIIGSTARAAGVGVDTLSGGAAVAQIQSLGNGDVVDFAGQTGAATINAMAGDIAVTLGGGPATVYGGLGDAINFGSVSQYADGTAGDQTIAVGSGGTDLIVGSTVPGGGDTLTGGAAAVQIQSLGKGDVVDFAGQTGNATINATAGNIRVTLGGGPATVYGGLGDAINFGSVSQYADGTAGDQTIAVGSSGTDIIIGSTLAAGSGVDILTGGAGVAEIQSLGKGDVVDFAAQTGAATINATAGNIAVTLGGGPATVYGGLGDAVNFGSVSQYADGTAGKQTIAVGSGGTDLVIGSMVSGGGDTLTGGAAALNYNPGIGGDLINLAGSTGAATVNAFGADNGPVNDTVIASNGGDSVWGGQGDRIGVGASAGGTDLFTHASTIPGAAIGFGTNDAAVAATYGGTAGAVTVNSAAPGASSAQVTVSGFAENKGTPTDFIFYPGESSATNTAIVATSTQITINGAASTQFTLPDGTRMTLLGVPQADFNSAFFKP